MLNQQFEESIIIRSNNSHQPEFEFACRKSSLPNDLWVEFNSLRTSPDQLIKVLQNRVQCYEQKLLFSPYHPYQCLQTREGKESLSSLIVELLDEKIMPAIERSKELDALAQRIADHFQHVQDLRNQNIVSLATSILQKDYPQHQNFKFQSACLFGVGFSNEWEPLISLLIDDGNQQRSNRKILLGQDYKFGGIGAVLLKDEETKNESLICSVFLLTKKQPQFSEDFR